jgi:hypothetical protein
MEPVGLLVAQRLARLQGPHPLDEHLRRLGRVDAEQHERRRRQQLLGLGGVPVWEHLEAGALLEVGADGRHVGGDAALADRVARRVPRLLRPAVDVREDPGVVFGALGLRFLIRSRSAQSSEEGPDHEPMHDAVGLGRAGEVTGGGLADADEGSVDGPPVLAADQLAEPVGHVELAAQPRSPST